MGVLHQAGPSHFLRLFDFNSILFAHTLPCLRDFLSGYVFLRGLLCRHDFCVWVCVCGGGGVVREKESYSTKYANLNCHDIVKPLT